MAQFFIWETKFSVFVPTMDAQHKKLVELVDRFFSASKLSPDKARNGKLLAELIDYTVIHFEEEEKYMAAIGFSGLREHKMFHKALVARAQEVKKEFEAGEGVIQQEVLNFLKCWLVTHIQCRDKMYSQREMGNEVL